MGPRVQRAPRGLGVGSPGSFALGVAPPYPQIKALGKTRPWAHEQPHVICTSSRGGARQGMLGGSHWLTPHVGSHGPKRVSLESGRLTPPPAKDKERKANRASPQGFGRNPEPPASCSGHG